MPGPNNAFLVKCKSGGGSQFSRDPLNLVNKHSRKVAATPQPFQRTANDIPSMPVSSTTRYATSDVDTGTRRRMPGALSEWKLIAFLGAGGWHSSGRESRHNLDYEEDKTSQSTSGQQEPGFMERTKIRAKVSHSLGGPSSWI